MVAAEIEVARKSGGGVVSQLGASFRFVATDVTPRLVRPSPGYSRVVIFDGGGCEKYDEWKTAGVLSEVRF
jgi:hypothetical protein